MYRSEGKTIVVPFDFSDEAKCAVVEAMRMAEAPSRVHVVHVIKDIDAHISDIPVAKTKQVIRFRREEQHLHEELAEFEGEGVHVQTCYGDPGAEIAKYAELIHADLLVIPPHGRGGVSRLLLGSVAERVLRLAHCPILVLKNLQRSTKQPVDASKDVSRARDSRQDVMTDK